MPDTVSVAAECMGVKVPASRFLNDTRIERINAARYEGQEIAGALHVTRPNDRVLEIGAGLGIVGAVVALNAKPEAVTSFEANPELVPEIEALYALNYLGGRISLRNQILISAPDRPDSMPFHLRSSYLGSSLLNPAGRPSTVVDVPTADFAAVCTETRSTVLIMDIEGGELELLRHADLGQFRAVVLEFHPEAYGVEGMRECKAILTGAGFARVEEKSTRTVWTCLRDQAG
ncbi:FkbM family methyltransferase [Ruegeria marina]|uniref:Methyltransferase, FkbM family n=1 Tax=Ruegeria marina TaxID=639004 RepID=A0A1G6LJ96_9RHOB|nr:FkbM family methyltransferase [Ruegeria marina]SDC43350.1 methyltransferase, FkbM family [Ruegeria marina]